MGVQEDILNLLPEVRTQARRRRHSLLSHLKNKYKAKTL